VTTTARTTNSRGKQSVIAPVSNDAALAIALNAPYTAGVVIEGVCPVLFHAWSNEAVAEKAKAAKNSTAKKTDNVESYVYRDAAGFIALPGEYLKRSIVEAARYRQDPRSPRKSAMDLYKAGVVWLTELAPILVDGKPTKEWAYIDQRRVTVMRSAITRSRPAFTAGWRAHIDLQVLVPEYIAVPDLLDVLSNAGKLIGVGDNRPSYGRFAVVGFEISEV
jgi:hypothetical protein